MRFDPIGWARERGVVAGAADPAATQFDVIDRQPLVDDVSLLAEIEPDVTAAALEARLRARGLTLGLFPEGYERESVGALVAANAPGAGASGPGFASLLVAETDGRFVLAVRPRPAAQAGRGVAFASFAAGVDAVRALAQKGRLPEIALLADAPGAAFWARVGELDELDVPAGGAVLVLIAAGAAGEAAARVGDAVRLVAADGSDLGQNVARAYAGARYDVAAHAATLAAAGYRLSSRTAFARWSLLAAEHGAVAGADVVGCEVCGATPHGARLVTRTLTAR